MYVSYGFRPRPAGYSGEGTASYQIRHRGHWVVEADIRDFLGTINHDKLVLMFAERVLAEGEFGRMVAGTQQGGVISPFLANTHLHGFDRQMCAAGLGKPVRHAENLMVNHRSPEPAEDVLAPVLRKSSAGWGCRCMLMRRRGLNCGKAEKGSSCNRLIGTSRAGLTASCGSNRAGTSVPTTYRSGPTTGSLVTASTDYEVASETRRRRDHGQRTVGKPDAGKPHRRVERGTGNPA